jgi:hypothetical protein
MLRLAFASILLLAVLVSCEKPSPARSVAALPFSITPPPGLALATETEKTKAYTPSGVRGPGGARLVLTRSSKVFDERDAIRRAGPEQFVRDVDEVWTPNSFQTSAISIDGLPGYETTADATDQQGAPVRVFCAKLYAADCTFTLFGYSADADREAFLDACRTAARSFTAR